jgi:hypothetical protein
LKASVSRSGRISCALAESHLPQEAWPTHDKVLGNEGAQTQTLDVGRAEESDGESRGEVTLRWDGLLVGRRWRLQDLEQRGQEGVAIGKGPQREARGDELS